MFLVKFGLINYQPQRERKREKKDTKITIANYQRPGWEYKHLSIGVYPVGYTPLLQHLGYVWYAVITPVIE